MKTIKAKHTTAWPQANSRGFTLVELLIVVSILGILAAIVIPEFQGHSKQAKEAAAKGNLRIIREAVERYALDHKGAPPGYFNGDTSTQAFSSVLEFQLTMYTNITGTWIASPTAGYPYGPYLLKIPKNPFNGLTTIDVLANTATSFPTTPTAGFGWIYMPTTKQVRIAYKEIDSDGQSTYEY